MLPPLMASEEFTATKTRGKRRSVYLPSCFRPSPASETPEAKAGTSRWWRLGGKQKTVPVNAVVDAPLRREEEEEAPPPPPPPSSAMDAVPAEKPMPVKCSFLHWFRKNQGKRIKSPIPTNHTQQQPQHPTNRADTITSKTQDSRVHQVMSKSRTRPEPAPLYRIHDRAQTTTQASHPGSPELNRHRATPSRSCGAPVRKKLGVGEFDSLIGLLVIAVVLAFLLLCGRMGAVIFVCTWMYLLPRIRVTSKIDGSRTGQKGNEDVDMDSTEYKKMVVLKGLLERDGRRPSSMKLSGTH